jgi:hypothetical protein
MQPQDGSRQKFGNRVAALVGAHAQRFLVNVLLYGHFFLVCMS